MNRSKLAAVALLATCASGAAVVAHVKLQAPPEASSTPIETEPILAARDETRPARTEAPPQKIEVSPASTMSVPAPKRSAIARAAAAAAAEGQNYSRPMGIPFDAHGASQALVIAGQGDVDLTAFADKAGPTVELTADEGDLEQAIQRRVPMFRDCYEEALKNNDNLQGTVHMSFDISGSGHVVQVGFGSDKLRNPDLKRCIRKRAMDWRFEKPNDGPVRVVTALAFGARSVSVAGPLRAYGAAKVISVR